MELKDFIQKFTNHPVLFVGTGFSLRYLNNSFTWDGLLSHISFELTGNIEHYLDIKSKHQYEGIIDYPSIAKDLENDFNRILSENRDGKFKEINDVFYEKMNLGENISRFKIYISILLSELHIKSELSSEITELKKVRKNIGSIVTTNYDQLIEHLFEFSPLVGNEILLSNPYGSIYKIHGCITKPSKIIINVEDYRKFNERYELIRAQLLSLFIHNPIIFIGYNIGDNNIKELLKTIFTYVPINTEVAEKIRSNFLLVEYQKDSTNTIVNEHDIQLEGFSTLRINKLKTDNFLHLYNELSNLTLPISAMDIRKVQSVVKEIYAGGNISVQITENIDDLANNEKVLAIGSQKTIKYEFHSSSEMIENYFKIIEESNRHLLELVDKLRIQSAQYFPIYGFSIVNPNLKSSEELKTNQDLKINTLIESATNKHWGKHGTIEEIFADETISMSNKINAIISAVYLKQVSLENLECYLKYYPHEKNTSYRKLICLYDKLKYGD